MIRHDLEKAASEIDKKMNESIAREVVMSLARGSVVLQNGDYLTEDELEADRDLMRNYRFQYLPK